MTQDVSVQSLSLNFGCGADAIISTIVGDAEIGRSNITKLRPSRRAIALPQNSVVRLAVLHTLRSAHFSRAF